MDAMREAIKQKRTPSGYAEEPEQTAQSGMAELIASLTPEQKQELMSLLQAEMPDQGQEASSEEVAQGGPTSEESAKIEAKLQEGPDEETDEVMLKDTRPLNRAPKGLIERGEAAARERMAKRGKA